MTQKLFWKDPYQTQCQAVVTAIDGRKGLRFCWREKSEQIRRALDTRRGA